MLLMSSHSSSHTLAQSPTSVGVLSSRPTSSTIDRRNSNSCQGMHPGSPARMFSPVEHSLSDLASPFHEQFTKNTSGPRAGEVKHHRHSHLTRFNGLGPGTWSRGTQIEQMEGRITSYSGTVYLFASVRYIGSDSPAEGGIPCFI